MTGAGGEVSTTPSLATSPRGPVRGLTSRPRLGVDPGGPARAGRFRAPPEAAPSLRPRRAEPHLGCIRPHPAFPTQDRWGRRMGYKRDVTGARAVTPAGRGALGPLACGPIASLTFRASHRLPRPPSFRRPRHRGTARPSRPAAGAGAGECPCVQPEADVFARARQLASAPVASPPAGMAGRWMMFAPSPRASRVG